MTMILQSLRLSAAALLGLTLAAPLGASERGWDKAGTIGEASLVLVALGAPALSDDWRGSLQAAESLAAAEAATWGLKELFPERRPDGSDRKSFPSGHTSLSFAAAAALQQRDGWGVGLPATAVAAFVGLSRVKADKHHWYDVAVGAAIGEVSGVLLTSRRDRRMALIPWGDAQSGGVALALRF